MPRLYFQKFDTDLSFREDFKNIKEIIDNNGVITGAPSINNKFTAVGTNATSISYTQSANILNNATKATIDLNITTPVDIVNNTYYLTKDNATTLIINIQVANSVLAIYFAAGIYATFSVLASTRYNVRYVYDGTLADPNKIKVYVNGVLQALSITGTIPTSLANTSIPWVVMGRTVTGPIHRDGAIIHSFQIWKADCTPECALNAYQNNTFTKIDGYNASIYLPTASSYYKENGTQQLTDGNMEAAGVANYPIINNATITKEITSPYQGTQWLKIAYNGTLDYGSSITILTNGKRYKLTGAARGDGAVAPNIRYGATTVWTGTSSTSWQLFNIEFLSISTLLGLYSNTPGSGYVGFDDLRLEIMENCTTNVGRLASYSLLGDATGIVTNMPTLLYPNGANFTTVQGITPSSLVLSNIKSFTVAMIIKINDLTAITHAIFLLGSYATNGILVSQYGSYFYIYRNSAAPSSSAANFFTSNETISLIVTSNEGYFYVYKNGKPIAISLPDQTAATALTETYTNRFGLVSGISGNMYTPSFWTTFTTPIQAKALHNKMMQTFNI